MQQTPKIYVDVRDDDGATSRVAIDSAQALIGRSFRAHVRLDREDVSRNHAELFCDPHGVWWVRDMNSMNGVQLNGELVTETRVQAGDHIQIGDFFTLVLGSPETHSRPPAPDASKRSDSGSDNSADPSGVSFDEVEFTSLDDGRLPEINTAHVHTLNEMGHRLADLAKDEERRRLICRTMVRRDFHGCTAMVLRVSKKSSRIPPQVLAQQRATHWHIEADYISRNLIRAVKRTGAPVLASNVSSDLGEVEISLSPEMGKMAAVACPLSETDDELELFYVVLPPRYGTPEWLAVIALAVKQYEQAVGYWKMRHEARTHAALEQNIVNARLIQDQLTPGDHRSSDLQIATSYHACKWVGRDVIDQIELSDGRQLIWMAQVEGAELEAALSKLRLHSMVRAHAQTNLSLPEMFTRLNDQLRCIKPSRGIGPAVSMLAIMIDPDNGQLQVVNAGHEPMVMVDAAGHGHALADTPGDPLGLDDMCWPAQDCLLEVGSVLAFASPGLLELKDNDGQSLGHRGFASLIAETHAKHHGKVAAMRDDLVKQIEAFEDGMLRRVDRSMLIVSRQSQ